MPKSATPRGGTQKSRQISSRLTGVTESNESQPQDLQADSFQTNTSDISEDTGSYAATAKIPAPEKRNPHQGRHSAAEDTGTKTPPDVNKTPPDVNSAIPVGSPTGTDYLIGTTIDARYVIESRIARGGMATVYRAKDTRLDRPVALKIMYPHLAESQDFVTRFRHEAKSAAKLAHPGIVAVYDQGSTPSTSYLVMELVQGPNLRYYLRSQGCIPLGKALNITKEIFDALAAAHRCGLVHRDVKPENVLIPPQDPVKVADFGLARAASEVTAATTGSILGTVAYLAPEIVLGETADARVDVYATGIILYELIAGTPPFTGDTPIQIAYAHVHHDAPRIRKSEPWVPEAVDALIAKLTERDPAKRPLDAQAAKNLVEDVIASLTPKELEMHASAEPTLESSEQLIAVMATPTLNEIPLQTTKQKSGRKKFFRQKPKLETLNPALSVTPPETENTISPTIRPKLAVAIVVLALLVVGLGASWFYLLGPGSFRPMPDVTNRQWVDASKTLQTDEIKFERVDSFDDAVPVGGITRTQPAPGKPIGRFQKAKIFVSKGIEMLKVPDLSGKALKEATDLIVKSRFAPPQVSEGFSETVPRGIVVEQSPAPGVTVAHNTTVKLIISKGREPVTVPSLSGKTRDEAIALLTKAGLNPAITSDYSDTIPKDTVITQSIKGGSTAYRHDQISLVISKGPRTVAIPNVQKKSEADATAALQSVGLKVKVERVFNVAGIVADTNPKAGTMVPVGSTVTIRMI